MALFPFGIVDRDSHRSGTSRDQMTPASYFTISYNYLLSGISIDRSLTAKEAHGWIYPSSLSCARLPSVSSGIKTSPESSLLLHQPQIPPRHLFGPATPVRSKATRMFSFALQGISNSLSHILILRLKTFDYLDRTAIELRDGNAEAAIGIVHQYNSDLLEKISQE